jgi:hypothetical protein
VRAPSLYVWPQIVYEISIRADTRMGCRMTTLAMRLLVLHRLLHTRLYAVERLHMALYFWLAKGAKPKVMQGRYSRRVIRDSSV